MDSNDVRDQAVAERQQADARASAVWRTLAVVTAWAVAASIRPRDLAAVAIVVDAALVVGGWWAIRPAARTMGPAFARADSWTKFLVTPVIIGAVLVLRDLWQLVVGA